MANGFCIKGSPVKEVIRASTRQHAITHKINVHEIIIMQHDCHMISCYMYNVGKTLRVQNLTTVHVAIQDILIHAFQNFEQNNFNKFLQ